MPERLVCSSYESPVGLLLMASGADGIVRLGIGEKIEDFISSLGREYAAAPAFDAAFHAGLMRMFDDYFRGRPVDFRVKVAPVGAGFDMAVWKALCTVPWGSRVSYGELACLAGSKGASRAVGGACGRNPVPIIIPCHRVLRSGGFIGGYSGPAGVKEKLLGLEGIPYKR